MPSTVTSTSSPTKLSSGVIKARVILGALWLLVVLQYGAVCYAFIVEPVIYEMTQGKPPDNGWDWSAVAYFVGLCFMLLLGVRVMRFVLKRVPNQLAVKHWAAGAAALSLPSLFCYVRLTDTLQLLSAQLAQGLSDFVYIPLVFSLWGLGFYMPFILLTCWVKYRYRDDEF